MKSLHHQDDDLLLKGSLLLYLHQEGQKDTDLHLHKEGQKDIKGLLHHQDSNTTDLHFMDQEEPGLHHPILDLDHIDPTRHLQMTWTTLSMILV
jgi:hypothetical protein